MSKWETWRHKQDHSVKYRAVLEGEEYLVVMVGDNRPVMTRIPKESFEQNYEREENDG
jgi:hypothetical protein